MLILNANDIRTLLSPTEIIASVKNGLIKYTNGEYFVPDRMHLGEDQLTYLLMPAIGPEYYCTKLVSVVPANVQKGLPYVSGTVTLNRVEDGSTLALMDAAMITALRTSAVGAIGFDLLSNSKIESIGMIGCGVQGQWQTIFADSVRSLKNVYCYSRTKDRFNEYKKQVQKMCPDLALFWCESGDEVVSKSQVIYACTTSSQPVFSNRKDLIKDKRFISVGSFRKGMQELPDVVYQEADILLIDTNTAKVEVGDVINAQNKGFFKEEQIVEMGKILSGDYKLKESDQPVFKSVGMAAFDLALAASLYEAAIAKNSGIEIKL